VRSHRPRRRAACAFVALALAGAVAPAVSARAASAEVGMPAISVSDTTVLEGTSPTGGAANQIVLTATLSRTSSEPVDATLLLNAMPPVDPYLFDDLAEGQDVEQPIHFAPGATSASITLWTRGDTDDEPDEQTGIYVQDLHGAVPGRTRATLTIVDDDGWDAATPAPPRNVAVRSARRGSVTASWQAPTAQSHAATRFWAVIASAGGKVLGATFVTWERNGSNPNDNDGTYSGSVGGLPLGIPVDVQVVGWSTAGSGTPSPTVRVVPALLAPSVGPAAAPLFAHLNLAASAQLHWERPTDDGGSGITGYVAVARDRATGATTAYRQVAADVRDVSLPGVDAGDDLAVAAITGFGVGLPAFSDQYLELPIPIQPRPPLTPAWVGASAGRRSITASWGPASEQGRPITGYGVIVVQAGHPTATRTVGPDARSAVVSGLAPGIVAEVWVVPLAGSEAGDLPNSPQRATPTA
jgi:hypothetical protein